MDNKDYVDVEYENVDNRIISGEPLFWTTTQVAEVLGEENSTIRYWSKRFENLLNIEVSNRNKQYKKSDIRKLKFIQKLAREDGLTLQQIQDYISQKGFDINDIEKAVLDANNPLAIQTFISAMTVEFDKKLNTLQEKMMNQVGDYFKQNIVLQQEMNDKLHENIVITVDEVISEKLDTKLSEIKQYMDQRELEAKNRDIEMIDVLKNNMEQRKIESEKEKSRGFFGKLFGK